MLETSNSIFNSNTDRYQSQKDLTPLKSASQQVFQKDEQMKFYILGY